MLDIAVQAFLVAKSEVSRVANGLDRHSKRGDYYRALAETSASETAHLIWRLYIQTRTMGQGRAESEEQTILRSVVVADLHCWQSMVYSPVT